MKPKRARKNGQATQAVPQADGTADPYAQPRVNGPPPQPRLASERSRSPYADEGDLVQTASAMQRFSTFAQAVRAAGLGAVLTGRGPLTVFAPTDRAFGKIAQGELDALFADTERLAELLRRHVVRGRVKAPRPETPRALKSIDGGALTLSIDTGAYHLNEARVVKTNIRASNGVIHAIDTVLTSR